MPPENQQRTVMFITGPVKKIEDELATLGNGWCAVEFSYHVIRDEACVTVRLMPAQIFRELQMRQMIATTQRPH